MGDSDRIKNRIKGIVVSIVLNGLFLLVLMSFSLPVVPPVHYEAGILFDFTDREEEPPQPMPIMRIMGEENSSKVNEPSRQKGPNGGIEVAPLYVPLSDKTRSARPNKQVAAKPATAGDDGDIERYEPERNKSNPRSLYQSSNNGTEDLDNKTNLQGTGHSLFPGTGSSDEPTRGPNAAIGTFVQEKGVGFSLAGRSVAGRLPLPAYQVQKEGKVVVEVTVDRDGNVVRANAILKGSTITDAQLIRAAEEAAKKSRFNSDGKATVMQTGTITYHFKLQ